MTVTLTVDLNMLALQQDSLINITEEGSVLVGLENFASKLLDTLEMYPTIFIKVYDGQNPDHPLPENVSEIFVDMIASGYDWTCPACKAENHVIETSDNVHCDHCDRDFHVREIYQANP